MRRRSLHRGIVVAALVSACWTPYYAVRSGPLTPCDRSAEPPAPGAPPGVCRGQFYDYERLLFQMGYDAGPRQHGSWTSLHQWSRTRSDTTDVITVEFAMANEGSGAQQGTSRRVLRINVSGRTGLRSGGRQRPVRESAVLRADVDAVADLLRQSFVQAQPRR